MVATEQRKNSERVDVQNNYLRNNLKEVISMLDVSLADSQDVDYLLSGLGSVALKHIHDKGTIVENTSHGLTLDLRAWGNVFTLNVYDFGSERSRSRYHERRSNFPESMRVCYDNDDYGAILTVV